jgi:hypothetical protein
MRHIPEGKHGARSTQQAIAIGLSKARRAGVKLRHQPAIAKARAKRSAEYATRAARHGATRPSPTRSRAVSDAPKREARVASFDVARAVHEDRASAAAVRVATSLPTPSIEPVISIVSCVSPWICRYRFFAAAFCRATRPWRIRFARSSSARRRALRFFPPRLMKY